MTSPIKYSSRPRQPGVEQENRLDSFTDFDSDTNSLTVGKKLFYYKEN